MSTTTHKFASYPLSSSRRTRPWLVVQDRITQPICHHDRDEIADQSWHGRFAFPGITAEPSRCMHRDCDGNKSRSFIIVVSHVTPPFHHFTANKQLAPTPDPQEECWGGCGRSAGA